MSHGGRFHHLLILLVLAGFHRLSAGQTIFDHLPPGLDSGNRSTDKPIVPGKKSADATAPAPTKIKLNCPAKFIMSLCTDQQGNVWAGTEDEGIWRLNPRTGESKQYTTADAVGDNSCYAIACDRLGRIWAGSLNHGLSVFNGVRWQNYDVVAGLSRPDSRNGPLGERVFAIKLCEKTGDVWVATNAGLSVYSETNDTWSYMTRADGLPSDQCNAIAFDKAGNAYLATQCDGIAIADAFDNYKHWRTVRGPDRVPLTPAGDGLPTSLINDVLVARNGTIYAATTTGLAWSENHGYSWRFIRGKDWADKVRGLYGGPPSGWREIHHATFAEDYCTCLAEGSDGLIWVGHREHGSEAIAPNGQSAGSNGNKALAQCVLAIGKGLIVGCYGEELLHENTATIPVIPATILGAAPPLPPGAGPPDATALKSLEEKARSLSRTFLEGVSFSEDWITEGDWVGRYGRQHNMLCAAMSPFDQQLIWDNLHLILRDMGPHHTAGDALRGWVHWIETDNPNTLYDPIEGVRRQSEWDDHGEAYPLSHEGPDIWTTIKVPAGFQRVSLYFFNKDGHAGGNRLRDYLIELYRGDVDPKSINLGPALARARVQNFWGGVYKQFLIRGPGNYKIRIARNYSKNTILSAVMIDRVAGPSTWYDTIPVAWLGGVWYNPPPISEIPKSGPALAALGVWLALDAGYPRREAVALQVPGRRLTLRAAIASGASRSLIDNWRWSLALWNSEDRAAFNAVMDDGWDHQIKISPNMVWEERKRMSKQQTQ